ncbi:unnamed protein product [Bemisia tabaci]|uniref:Uncharacterized protein n=1 Tax=Bemisia tabaci TaxID=7038 RepID=A0A9P0EYT9_BEMTA|nr:unnamed protein product [Bemisia tabaci]
MHKPSARATLKRKTNEDEHEINRSELEEHDYSTNRVGTVENYERDWVIASDTLLNSRENTTDFRDSCLGASLKINFDLDRNEILDLKGSYLTVAHCEALEEIFKRVQFVVLNVGSTCLDDEAATSLFDMLEYYESATHLVLSDNHLIDSRGWQACSRMIKRMRCLEILEARSVSLNDQLMPLLTRSLRVGSQLQVLKLENCHLTGRPFLILGNF